MSRRKRWTAAGSQIIEAGPVCAEGIRGDLDNLTLSTAPVRRTIVIRWLSIVILMALCAVANGEEFTVLPGERIGKLKLGARQAGARRIMGKPKRTLPTHGGRTLDSWPQPSGKELEAVYQGGKIVQLKSSSASFHFGKESMPLNKALPRLKSTIYLYNRESGRGVEYRDDVKRGVAFVFRVPSSNESGKNQPLAIIVHKRNQPAIPTDVKEPSNIGSVERKKHR
jgi:hypothetical protein